MSISTTWNRLPGPADFLDTIIEDLVGGNTVLVGIPDTIRSRCSVMIAETVKRKEIGRWAAVRSWEAHQSTLNQFIENHNSDAKRLVLWVEATDEDTVSKWVKDARHSFADGVETPRVCIAMPMDHAEVYQEDSGLRRHLWTDFVTASDSRVLIERWGRYFGRGSMHIALKSILVAEITGSDLALAEQLAHKPLRQMLDPSESCSDHIWVAQVSVLFPLIDRERRRLLMQYQDRWHLPHIRENKQEIQCIEKLEVGDMDTQVKHQYVNVNKADRELLNWLRRVRNALAHHDIVPWGTLTSPEARQIANFG